MRKAISIVCTFLLQVSFAQDLSWKVIHNKNALCNDYTPAGYFVVRGRTHPQHWVIFLESGGGCYSPDTCNARYFNQNVRTTFKYSDSPSIGPLTRYDIAKAKTSSTGKPLNEFVSPLVTSIVTFQNTTYFKNGRISVKGQTILDDDCTNNPIFCNHTRVIIPYCSSDLWLANSPSLACNISKDLYNQCYANDSSSCVAIGETYFKNCFLNSSNQLSFAFRGQAIYRGALEQLLDEGLADSSTVTLVGSSAGGVGVINHANWTLQLLRNWTRGSNLSVIADSSWFINFRDNVYKLFVGLSSSGNVRNGSVFNIITATDTTTVTCNDKTRGTPCCFSAFCMLSTPEYYPSRDVSTFLLFGLYDVYLLAESLIGLNITEVGQTSGLAVKFIQTISEYGGAMNDSLSVSSSSVGRLSYYVTQCFQHIYLVTSTLWGVGNLFGNHAVDIDTSFGFFRQSMDPDTWYSMQVGVNKTTIRDAISQWYPNRYTGVIAIRDNCAGPHCNSMCPEDISLLLSSDAWSSSVQIVVFLIVLVVALCCLLAKASFWLWYVHLNHKQSGYLRGLVQNMEERDLEFPECANENGVSVSCLDLQYSVTVRTAHVKDEKKDDIAPIALKRLQSEPNGDVNDVTRTATTPAAFKSIHEYLIHYAKRKSEMTLSANSSQQQLPTNNHNCYTTKEILKGISIYFNPGDLCAIMGPSGCGKTTFLDLLTGRRTDGTIGGHIFVNGLPLEQIKDWYIANTGYVLQLATPYYEELTVRENLTLAAQIKLPNIFSLREKFTRVEQVIAVSELRQFADTVVGGTTGPGLSGGQKRRLAIALQLLKLPSVLFLDEPTSGLDATSSYELLTHLNRLADSKRTVVLTIHQPRLEIFHMFNRLVLLTDGKIAYHGVPEKAYEVFIKALQSKYWRNAPQLENENPADVIMDVAGNHKLRAVITKYYERSTDPQLVHSAIMKACLNSRSKSRESLDSVTQKVKYAIFGAKRVGNYQGSLFNRLAALEARGAKRASFGQMLYLPTIFFAYGVLLGTVYYQSHSPLLLLSGFCVYSVASALFMFPALYLYYQRALEVYAYEHADGAGSPWDIVIQGFIRGITLGFFPVVLCAAILYLLLVNAESYNVYAFGQVVLINLALNQTWVALLIFVICAFPKIAFRLSPIISSVAGFTSGFFIPRESMPVYYRWLFYINPNYYGFSASANILLDKFKFQTGCVGSVFECFSSSPSYFLKGLNFNDINPYFHITVLLGFTVLFIWLATLSNCLRYFHLISNIKRLLHLLRLQREADDEELVGTRENSSSEDNLLETENHQSSPEANGTNKMPKQTVESDSELAVVASDGAKVNPKVRWQKVVEKCKQAKVTGSGENSQAATKEASRYDNCSEKKRTTNEQHLSLFLNEGEGHVVWKPKEKGQHLRFAAVVGEVLSMPRSLSERRKNLEKRVLATRAVLRADSKGTVGQCPPDTKRHMSFKDAANRVRQELHRDEHYHFHDVVSQYVACMHSERHGSIDSTSALLKLSAPPLRRVHSKDTSAHTKIEENTTVPVETMPQVSSFPDAPSTFAEEKSQDSHCTIEGSQSVRDKHNGSKPPVSPSKDSMKVSELNGTTRHISLAGGNLSKVATSGSHKVRLNRQKNYTQHESWC